MRQPVSDKGNILFMLLLAIILLAALVYAVNNSLRGGGKDATTEQADLLAAQLIQYGSLVENNFQRALLVNNIKEYGMSMEGPHSFESANATCTVAACRMFVNNGADGIMQSASIPQEASTSAGVTNKKMNFVFANVVNVGTDKEDIIFYYGYVKKEVCEAINAKLGLNVDLTISDTFGGTVTTGGGGHYSGTLTSIPTTNAAIGDASTGIVGRLAGCYGHSTAGYIFYQVLLAR